jgi:pimeloyl-ACP methyl ester carboxylesterase
MRTDDITTKDSDSALQDIAHLASELPEWFKTAMSVPRAEGFVDVRGCPIRYFRWGDSDKPGVVMTHGFLAHSRCFAFIAPLLADDFQLVAFDLSGMGESGARESYEANIRAVELHTVCKTNGLLDDGRKPAVVAHSFGGSVALAAADLYPDEFSSVVIADMMMMRPEVALQRMGDRPRRFSEQSSRPNNVYATYEEAFARFKLAPPQPCANDYLFEYMAQHSLKRVDGGWTWKFHPSIMGSDSHEPGWWEKQAKQFANLKGRKAIIHGEKSDLFPADSVAYVHELLDDRTPIISIPDAHHHLMLDQPLAFASALKTLLLCWAPET